MIFLFGYTADVASGNCVPRSLINDITANLVTPCNTGVLQCNVGLDEVRDLSGHVLKSHIS